MHGHKCVCVCGRVCMCVCVYVRVCVRVRARVCARRLLAFPKPLLSIPNTYPYAHPQGKDATTPAPRYGHICALWEPVKDDSGPAFGGGMEDAEAAAAPSGPTAASNGRGGRKGARGGLLRQPSKLGRQGV